MAGPILAGAMVEYMRAVPGADAWFVDDEQGNLAIYAEDYTSRFAVDTTSGGKSLHATVGPSISIQEIPAKVGVGTNIRETFDVQFWAPRSFATSVGIAVIGSGIFGGLHRQPAALAPHTTLTVWGIEALGGFSWNDNEFWWGRTSTVTVLFGDG